MRLQILMAALAMLPFAWADTLTLRDGRTVEGQYLGGSARQIRLAVGDGVQTFDVTDVADLHFEAAKAPAAQPAPKPAPAAQPAPPAQPAVSAQTGTAQAETAVERAAEPAPEHPKILHVEPAVAAPATAGAAGVALPTGTAILIRMIDAVDSKQARPGQTFRASVDEPVMLGERTVVPRGADVVTRLVEVKDASKISGGGHLTLVLASVNVNGRTVNVDSESVTHAGESGKGDSAKVIGGTAALGAIIGAIAGGGKGAAIGAVSGAGAGTAVRVLTSGAEVRIPSETRLTFTLQSPVKL